MSNPGELSALVSGYSSSILSSISDNSSKTPESENSSQFYETSLDETFRINSLRRTGSMKSTFSSNSEITRTCAMSEISRTTSLESHILDILSVLGQKKQEEVCVDHFGTLYSQVTGRVFKYENYGYSDTMAMMQDLAGIHFVYDNLLFLTA